MRTGGWRDRLLLAAPVLAIAGLMIVSPTDRGPTICPFALCTGIACPGCGLTRAAGSLIRGHFGTAMTYHPLIPLIAVEAAVLWGWWFLRRRGVVRPLPTRAINGLAIATAVSLIAVWVVRLSLGSLPPV